MAGLQTILGVAQALLPANSPWRQRIEQAAQMASQFAPTKDGVAQLMAANGKRRDDLLAAVKQLDNPIVKKAMGFVPGLSDAVRSAASELERDQSFAGNPGTSSPHRDNYSTSDSSYNDIMERIKRL